MHVVATAGHVDHGKSTLVEALTGQQPDRLAEERRRGLSIRLGYCWTDLDGAGEVAFVDVPGHERFLATALAGVGPVTAVMFVVAADDPWMPQAAEHLAALDALGVEHGVLVVTRADLTDPGPALARARAALQHTSLRALPSAVVSGRTGEGLDVLRTVLAHELANLPPPDPAAPARLWVDRRFHVKGAGTVVTGTLSSGTVTAGDVLEWAGSAVRVRGIEALGRPRTSMTAPARVALDLGGHAPTALAAGTALVSPGGYPAATLVDVRLTAPDDGRPRPPRTPLLHLGTASAQVQLRPLDEQHVRLRLEQPWPLRVGDRALLRDPGSRTVWGVEVLDPMPPPLSRRGDAAARGRALASYDGTVAAELRLRGVVRRSDLDLVGVRRDVLPGDALEAGPWLVDGVRAASLRQRLHDLVDEARAQTRAVSRSAAADLLGLPADEIVSALVAPPLREEDGLVLGPGSSDLPDAWASALDEVRRVLTGDPFAAPDRSRMRELGLDARALAVLERGGHLLRLPEDVVLLPGADHLARVALGELEQPFTTSEARRALGTSRRVVLPLLAHLDRTGVTVRLPDDRRRLV